MYSRTIEVAELGVQTKAQVKERITFQMHCQHTLHSTSTQCHDNHLAIRNMRIMDSQASKSLTLYAFRENRTYIY